MPGYAEGPLGAVAGCGKTGDSLTCQGSLYCAVIRSKRFLTGLEVWALGQTIQGHPKVASRLCGASAPSAP